MISNKHSPYLYRCLAICLLIVNVWKYNTCLNIYHYLCAIINRNKNKLKISWQQQNGY
ncbi:MAG: hypothetical protein JWQ85_23 [Mucilaginibacter sp.]|nr:hypothetical protein [Mucilaginibacter sp.]